MEYLSCESQGTSELYQIPHMEYIHVDHARRTCVQRTQTW